LNAIISDLFVNVSDRDADGLMVDAGEIVRPLDAESRPRCDRRGFQEGIVGLGSPTYGQRCLVGIWMKSGVG
tara:strand:- start:25625 stop:25840 length:216 start_codon:yes stop_codon:yes gene_type:complete